MWVISRSQSIFAVSCFWTPGGSQKGPIKQGLFGRFLGIVSLVFSKFWHGARNQFEVERNRVRFSRKHFLPKKLGKGTNNGPKTEFFLIY